MGLIPMADIVPPFDRVVLEQLIPHAGAMCLIDRVEHWDSDRLRARCWSHHHPGHPLRRKGQLRIWHTLEYAAQAMAIHGGLLAHLRGEKLGQGFLAGTRNVAFHRAVLHSIETELTIEVVQQFAQSGNLIYDFQVASADAPLAEGTATVVGRQE